MSDEEAVVVISPAKRNKRGKLVSLRQKEMIINAYKTKMEANPKMTLREVRSILSKELGIGEKTICNTITEYRNFKTVTSPNKQRIYKNVNTKTDDFDKYAIRRKIHNLWLNRELPTIDKILSVINEDKSLPSFSRATLHRLLKSMDIVYTKRGRNSALLDSNDLTLWRRRYLRDIRKYREEGRPIYYLYETWVNTRDLTDKVWVNNTIQSSLQYAVSHGLTTGPVNPSSKGKHLISVHIGSEDGFVPGGLLSFESKKNTRDYHDEINGRSFRDWLQSVLPKLKDNAVIVMDNAPYHSIKVEECPTTNWKKADIIEWLQSKGEVIDNTMIVAELLDVVKRLKPLYNKYEIDELVLQQNKTVLRLPPYHCELNPIEMAWSVVKNHVKFNNKKFKLKDVQNLLNEGVNKVTIDMWKNFITHTIKEEDKFWNIDMIVDELMAESQPCVMTIGQSDDDSLFSDLD